MSQSTDMMCCCPRCQRLEQSCQRSMWPCAGHNNPIGHRAAQNTHIRRVWYNRASNRRIRFPRSSKATGHRPSARIQGRPKGATRTATAQPKPRHHRFRPYFHSYSSRVRSVRSVRVRVSCAVLPTTMSSCCVGTSIFCGPAAMVAPYPL